MRGVERKIEGEKESGRDTREREPVISGNRLPSQAPVQSWL